MSPTQSLQQLHDICAIFINLNFDAIVEISWACQRTEGQRVSQLCDPRSEVLSVLPFNKQVTDLMLRWLLSGIVSVTSLLADALVQKYGGNCSDILRGLDRRRMII